MKRSLLKRLIEWKVKPIRKPLIIRGTRQVGKTWLMQEFGKAYYEQTIYLNFEKSKRLKNLFIDDFDIERIKIALQAESGLTIDPANTLIIFDEIQAVPEAITALKYFNEDATELHVIAAGSLLGVALHSNTSFPVGKVEFMDLYPLSFIEFLEALNENSLVSLLQLEDWKLLTAFKSKLINRLRQYYYVGGMPEAVKKFAENNSFVETRIIQNQILSAFEQDFSKHAPIEIVPRIRMLWNSIPAQLAKENKKFIYGILKEGARAKDYELALSWLIDSGLVYKICRTAKPSIPLKAYEDRNAFKLFIADVGLMSAMGDIDSKTLLEGNAIFHEFKGAITEQFVLQQLINTNNYVLYYWSAEKSTSEIDFLLQYKNIVVPMEVKAEENLQAKSLKTFNEKYKPVKSIRISMSDYRQQDWIINFPLYCINNLSNSLNSLCDKH